MLSFTILIFTLAATLVAGQGVTSAVQPIRDKVCRRMRRILSRHFEIALNFHDTVPFIREVIQSIRHSSQ
ncbi:hypothetical protein LA080_004598 [Diaporthe eres]|nr:hypothetical protein LA080_004598 [Diaporthe eres]